MLPGNGEWEEDWMLSQGVWEILTDLRWKDVLDILVIAAFAYTVCAWLWRTRGLKVLMGFVVLGGFFGMAKHWGLFLTTWVFQSLWQVALLLVIVIFQPELRQFLERVNPLGWIRGGRRPSLGSWAEALAETAFFLAQRNVGALIVVEGQHRVDQHASGGVVLNADVSPLLLMAIFQKESPLHDGAVVIRGGRILKAGCFLPLCMSESVPQEWGTRHRAALGLTEACDAGVIVVSEENGRVSLAHKGRMVEVRGPGELLHHLGIGIGREPKTFRRWAGKKSWLALGAKVACLAVVGLLWVILAGEQDVEVTLVVPVETRNLPERWEIVEPEGPEVKVTIRGTRRDVVTLDGSKLYVDMDLSLAQLGRRTFRVGKNEVVLPNPRLEVVKVEPSEIKFRFRERG